MQLSIVVCKRSCRENFRVEGLDFHKKEKEAKKRTFGRGGLWKLPQPVEIDKGGLRHFFLMISTTA
jgi:hypothetical protein